MVHSRRLAVSRLLPVHSDEQTFAATDGMSRMGHNLLVLRQVDSRCGPDRYGLLAIKQRYLSLRVTGEDKVARFDLIVAGGAGFLERLVARFAVLEVSETPTARAMVTAEFLGGLAVDHQLEFGRPLYRQIGRFGVCPGGSLTPGGTPTRRARGRAAVDQIMRKP
jgi:hypothetical protein